MACLDVSTAAQLGEPLGVLNDKQGAHHAADALLP
jgi:hypothetical protein